MLEDEKIESITVFGDLANVGLGFTGLFEFVADGESRPRPIIGEAEDIEDREGDFSF